MQINTVNKENNNSKTGLLNISSICEDLVQHSSTLHKMLSKGDMICNPYIKGHMEAHFEKVEDSLFAILNEYEISENRFSQKTDTIQTKFELNAKTQRQGMRLLSQNIQILKYKLGVLLSKASEITRAKLKPLDELSIKLENDLSRTTYLMQ